MYTGSCLCGSVAVSVEADFSTVEFCHCSVCRKAHSSAFAIGVTISSDEFNVTAGRELLSEYQSSEGKFRVFCSRCGSHMYAYRPAAPQNVRLRPAILDTDLNQFSVKHIFEESSGVLNQSKT